jgi:hypothetical protein
LQHLQWYPRRLETFNLKTANPHKTNFTKFEQIQICPHIIKTIKSKITDPN